MILLLNIDNCAILQIFFLLLKQSRSSTNVKRTSVLQRFSRLCVPLSSLTRRRRRRRRIQLHLLSTRGRPQVRAPPHYATSVAKCNQLIFLSASPFHWSKLGNHGNSNKKKRLLLSKCKKMV